MYGGDAKIVKRNVLCPSRKGVDRRDTVLLGPRKAVERAKLVCKERFGDGKSRGVVETWAVRRK